MSMIHANVPLVKKSIYIWFVKPIFFATPNGVATLSLRSPGVDSGIDVIVKFPNYHCFWSQRIYYITIDVCSYEHGAGKIINLPNIQHMSAIHQ